MRLLVAALLIVIGGVAEARMKAGPVVMSAHVSKWTGASGGSVVPPPLDGISTSSIAAFSMRKLRTAYVGNSAQIRRASDNAVLDIGFTGGGDFDTAAATTHCNATTCFFAKWYDQSGNARDMVQASAAAQPALIFGCAANGAPCLRTTLSTHTMITAVQSGTVISYGAVAKRGAGTGSCNVVTQTGNNRVQAKLTTAGWTLVGNAATFIDAPSATEGAWHAISAVTNGASSYISTDGTTVSGSSTADTAIGPIRVLGATSTTCDETEAIVWTGYALTAGEAASLNTNQHTYWGF